MYYLRKMFGIVLTLIAIIAIGFGAFRVGASGCFDDPTDRDASRNTATVVIVLGIMFAVCGMLSLLGGGGLPFNALVPSKDSLADLL